MRVLLCPSTHGYRVPPLTIHNYLRNCFHDSSIDADRFYEVYQKRWRIEEFHKSIKQNASLAKSPTKIIRTQCNHIFAAMVAFCKLELLKVKTSLNHFAIKHKLLLKANQIIFLELQKLKTRA